MTVTGKDKIEIIEKDPEGEEGKAAYSSCKIEIWNLKSLSTNYRIYAKIAGIFRLFLTSVLYQPIS